MRVFVGLLRSWLQARLSLAVEDVVFDTEAAYGPCALQGCILGLASISDGTLNTIFTAATIILNHSTCWSSYIIIVR